MKVKIIFSDECLEYGVWHIEGPERVMRAYEILKQRGYEILKPNPALEVDILHVHEKEYVRRLEDGIAGDADTPSYDEIYRYAKLAAGGAILAAEVEGFSLMRPPGHHAGKNGVALGASTRGFCYLNNVAIAVRCLDEPALILDIDGHHGNGTQEIFQGDGDVTYVGLHRYPHYPGTGFSSEGNCLNFPLKPNCGNEEYLKVLREALNLVDLEKVEVLAVSAGFDTHVGDLASLGLTGEGYRRIGKLLSSLNIRTFFVLEGGYSGENNGRDIHQLLTGFSQSKT